MYFTSIIRFSPAHGRELPYYKIKESFRDVIGRVHACVMLTPGYLPELCSDEIVQIRRGLMYLMEQNAYIPGQQTMFDADPRQDYNEKVRVYSEQKDKLSIKKRLYKAALDISYLKNLLKI